MRKLNLFLLTVCTVLLFANCSKKDNEEDNTPDPNAVVSIPDSKFKDALLNHSPVIDANNDGEIQVSEAAAVTVLWLEAKGITNLTGLSAFSALQELYLSSNTTLSSIDVSENTELRNLNAPFLDLTTIDLSNNEKLQKINFQDNLFLESITYPTGNSRLEEIGISATKISSLPVSGLTALKYVTARDTKLTEMDFSQNSQLSQVFANQNPQLTSVNIKNGNIAGIIDIDFLDCPNLSIICVDDVDAANAKDPDRWKKDPSASYSTTCN